MRSPSRHCEERQRRGNPLKTFWIASLALAMTFLSISATAQEMPTEKPAAETQEATKNLSDILAETTRVEGEVRYAPEGCDFEITFPSEPYTAMRCARDSGNAKNCTKLTSYTMVYDVTATIEVSVTCVPSTPEKYKSYTEKVISLALNGMVSRADITDHEINIIEDEDTRQGSLLGSAKRGKQNSIYNAQLWIGQNSIMTMEAKLIGPFHAEADTVFSEILGSVKRQEK